MEGKLKLLGIYQLKKYETIQNIIYLNSLKVRQLDLSTCVDSITETISPTATDTATGTATETASHTDRPPLCTVELYAMTEFFCLWKPVYLIK